MRFSPLTIILIVLLVVFVFGGRTYNGGMYANYGYGGGGLLLILVLLLLFGVL